MPAERSAPLPDFYAVLGVPRAADQAAIKGAYRRLAMKHHPDRGGDQEKFKEMCRAYAILSNPDQKAAYDGNMAAGGRAGLASTIFGPMFDDLVGRVQDEGISSGNLDSIFSDFFKVAKDVKVRIPQKVQQAGSSPGNLLDFIEQVFDGNFDAAAGKKK